MHVQVTKHLRELWFFCIALQTNKHLVRTAGHLIPCVASNVALCCCRAVLSTIYKFLVFLLSCFQFPALID